MTQFLKIIFISSLIAVYGCGESGILESSGSGNISAVDGASQWDESLFPLKVQISNEFSASEKSDMADVGATWGQAHGSLNFFDFSDTPAKSVGQLTDYKDDVFGIYKMHNKLAGYPDRALAITQIYADRINYDGKSYLAIRHADIVVNYADYAFKSDSSYGNYDLKTVVLHELGHFVGIDHYQDGSNPSIMEPSIDTFDVIHYPYPKDEELIQANYKPGATSVSSLRSIASLSDETRFVDGDKDETNSKVPTLEEEGVRVVHMLKADKSCEHYINGKLVHKH